HRARRREIASDGSAGDVVDDRFFGPGHLAARCGLVTKIQRGGSRSNDSQRFVDLELVETIEIHSHMCESDARSGTRFEKPENESVFSQRAILRENEEMGCSGDFGCPVGWSYFRGASLCLVSHRGERDAMARVAPEHSRDIRAGACGGGIGNFVGSAGGSGDRPKQTTGAKSSTDHSNGSEFSGADDLSAGAGAFARRGKRPGDRF